MTFGRLITALTVVQKSLPRNKWVTNMAEKPEGLIRFVRYKIDFPCYEAPPTQEEFEELMTDLSMWGMTVRDLLDGVDFEAIVLGDGKKPDKSTRSHRARTIHRCEKCGGLTDITMCSDMPDHCPWCGEEIYTPWCGREE